MAKRIRVVVTDLPPTTPTGGDLEKAFTVHTGLAETEVLFELRYWVDLVKEFAEEGWPVGPERGRPHSRDLFAVSSVQTGDRVGLKLTNSADYARFIHEPGNKSRFVVDREINERIDALEEYIGEALLDAFIRGFNEG